MAQTDGATVSTYDGTLNLQVEGVVYDADTGLPVEGAKVTAWERVASSGDSGAAYDVWPGSDFGQTNPQTTGTDGAYAFAPPSGRYKVTVSKDGYQEFQTGVLVIEDEWLNLDIPLSPEVGGEADYQVRITRNGFNPSVLRAPAGSVVEFLNVDVYEHTSTSQGTSVNAGDGSWDSGDLKHLDGHRVVVGDEGVYEYFDRTNPANEGVIIAETSLHKVFLPLVIR